MPQVDYFSFGDEELDAELDLIDLRGDSPDQAVALVEPLAGDELGADEDWFGSSAERAARPRGDSKIGSSERRLPSSRRTRTVAAVALGLLALFLVRTAISTLGGGEPAAQSASASKSTSTRTARSAAPTAADLDARRAEGIRASRERAAEGQRVRQHRAQTRRRARRRRQRIAAERQQHARVRRAQAASREEASAAPAEGPATDYVPPTYEPAPPPSSPAPEPAPEPPSQPHIQNGANSPEFGL